MASAIVFALVAGLLASVQGAAHLDARHYSDAVPAKRIVRADRRNREAAAAAAAAAKERQELAPDPAANLEFPVRHTFDELCKRMLWVVGLELFASSGFLAEGSHVYTEYLLVALKSAHTNAPNLQPVVVLRGTEESNKHVPIAKFKELGAIVLFHELSFLHAIESAIERGVKPRYGDKTPLGTYLRVDLPAIMPKILAHVDENDVDTHYVLWTDPDVLFYDDFDSCTLPRPVIASIGGDTGHEVPASLGVVYYNVAAYSSVFSDVLRYGEATAFGIDLGALDQDFLLNFMGDRFNLLPDIYAYKPYFGKVPAPVYGPSGSIALMHIQGPKLHSATCVMSALRALDKAAELNWAELNATAANALHECAGSKVQAYNWIAKCLAYAYAQDRGELYFDVAVRFKEFHQQLAAEAHGSSGGANDSGGIDGGNGAGAGGSDGAGHVGGPGDGRDSGTSGNGVEGDAGAAGAAAAEGPGGGAGGQEGGEQHAHAVRITEEGIDDAHQPARARRHRHVMRMD